LPQQGEMGSLGNVPQEPDLTNQASVTDANLQKDTKKAEI